MQQQRAAIPAYMPFSLVSCWAKILKDSSLLLLLQQQAHAGPADIQYTHVWPHVLQVRLLAMLLSASFAWCSSFACLCMSLHASCKHCCAANHQQAHLTAPIRQQHTERAVTSCLQHSCPLQLPASTSSAYNRCPPCNSLKSCEWPECCPPSVLLTPAPMLATSTFNFLSQLSSCLFLTCQLVQRLCDGYTGGPRHSQVAVPCLQAACMEERLAHQPQVHGSGRGNCMLAAAAASRCEQDSRAAA
jgi:hypothetical protein